MGRSPSPAGRVRGGGGGVALFLPIVALLWGTTLHGLSFRHHLLAKPPIAATVWAKPPKVASLRAQGGQGAFGPLGRAVHE